MFGARLIASEAKALAQEADRKAMEVMGSLRDHVKDCAENQKNSAVWRGEVKTVLQIQNKDLEKIQGFLSKILLTALGTLIVVVGFMVFYGVHGIHP